MHLPDDGHKTGRYVKEKHHKSEVILTVHRRYYVEINAN